MGVYKRRREKICCNVEGRRVGYACGDGRQKTEKGYCVWLSRAEIKIEGVKPLSARL
jgi:hypothetical protein